MDMAICATEDIMKVRIALPASVTPAPSLGEWEMWIARCVTD